MTKKPRIGFLFSKFNFCSSRKKNKNEIHKWILLKIIQVVLRTSWIIWARVLGVFTRKMFIISRVAELFLNLSFYLLKLGDRKNFRSIRKLQILSKTRVSQISPSSGKLAIEYMRKKCLEHRWTLIKSPEKILPNNWIITGEILQLKPPTTEKSTLVRANLKLLNVW